MRDLLARKSVGENMSMTNEDARGTFQHPLCCLAPPRDVSHRLIESEKHAGRDNTSGDRFVIADECVLNAFAENQQDDEIERRHLADMSLANDAQEKKDGKIDQPYTSCELNDTDR